MRPSSITDGIVVKWTSKLRTNEGFNEAVEYYRRNPACVGAPEHPQTVASMRPSSITDGIPGRDSRSIGLRPSRFNEAVEYYRRNRRLDARPISGQLPRFNEAVEYYRRSPRWPPDVVLPGGGASMRPSSITDGIARTEDAGPGIGTGASMRPSSITDGISPSRWLLRLRSRRGFNEAVEYYRRNQSLEIDSFTRGELASMRPSSITDGIGDPVWDHVFCILRLQ